MSSKISLFIFAFAIIVAVVVWNQRALSPASAAPSGISNFKLFYEGDIAITEQFVNDWLAAQNGIVIDRVTFYNFGGSYFVALGYRSSGSGAVSTRIKIFDSPTTVETETAVNDFLNSLSSSRNVKATDVAQGNAGPAAILVVYD